MSTATSGSDLAADEVAGPCSTWSTPSLADSDRAPDLRFEPLAWPGPAARPLPAEGRGRARRGRWPPSSGFPAWRSRSSIPAAAAWPARSATSTATTTSASLWPTACCSRLAARSRGPARRPRLLVPQPGARPGEGPGSAPNSASGRATGKRSRRELKHAGTPESQGRTLEHGSGCRSHSSLSTRIQRRGWRARPEARGADRPEGDGDQTALFVFSSMGPIPNGAGRRAEITKNAV